MGWSKLAILLLATLAIVQQHSLLVSANPAVMNSDDDTESVSMDNPLLSGSRGIRKNAVLAMAPSRPLLQKEPEVVYSGLQRNAFTPVTAPPASVQCSSTVKDVLLGFRGVVNDAPTNLKPFLTDVLNKGESDLIRQCSRNNGESIDTGKVELTNIITNHQWATEKFKF